MLGSVWLGGDALNGRIADGHFFVANKGSLREVSEAVFTYSRWHALSVLFTVALYIALGFLIERLRKSN